MTRPCFHICWIFADLSMYYDHGCLDMFVLGFEHSTIEPRCEYCEKKQHVVEVIKYLEAHWGLKMKVLGIFENMIANLTFCSFHVFFRIYLEMFANGIGISNP